MKTYSKNPKDWYFDVQDIENKGMYIALSQYPFCIDDELRLFHIPNEIKSLLPKLHPSPLESVWQIDIKESKEKFIESLIQLGFHHSFELASTMNTSYSLKEDLESEKIHNNSGLSLSRRDYFAAMAMQGLLAADATYNRRTDDRESLIKDAIAYGNELLKQLDS